MLLDGIHVPLLTPFYPDGRVYLRKLEHNVRRLSLTPVSGLVALGEGSEVHSLSEEEQRDVLRAVAATAAAEKVLTATLNQAGCEPALALAELAAELHFDALVLQAPAIYGSAQGTSRELLTWLRVLADRAPLPVLLASNVGHHAIPVEVLAELAEHPNVLGVLEQSRHISRVAELRAASAHVRREVTTTVTFTAATRRMLEPAIEDLTMAGGGATFVSAEALAGGAGLATRPATPVLRTRTKQVGAQILWAHAADATEALRAGANGLAPLAASGVPQAVFEIWAAWKDGDTSLMHGKQARVAAAEPAMLEGGAPLVKFAAELSGYFGGRPRLPLVSPTEPTQQALVHLLDGMRA